LSEDLQLILSHEFESRETKIAFGLCEGKGTLRASSPNQQSLTCNQSNIVLRVLHPVKVNLFQHPVPFSSLAENRSTVDQFSFSSELLPPNPNLISFLLTTYNLELATDLLLFRTPNLRPL